MSTLKECLYATIHRNKKPLKLIAEEIGMSENYLTRSALPDLEESDTGSGCRFPLKKLIPLIMATGDFSMLDHIEQSLGRVAVCLPKPGLAGQEICRQTMLTVKEFGDLMAELNDGMADGRIIKEELDRIVEEGHEAIQAIVTLLDCIERSKK